MPRHLSELMEDLVKIGMQRREVQKALDNIDSSGCKDLLDRLKAGVQGSLSDPLFTSVSRLRASRTYLTISEDAKLARRFRSCTFRDYIFIRVP
jgi:hypothetical protein